MGSNQDGSPKSFQGTQRGKGSQSLCTGLDIFHLRGPIWKSSLGLTWILIWACLYQNLEPDLSVRRSPSVKIFWWHFFFAHSKGRCFCYVNIFEMSKKKKDHQNRGNPWAVVHSAPLNPGWIYRIETSHKLLRDP